MSTRSPMISWKIEMLEKPSRMLGTRGDIFESLRRATSSIPWLSIVSIRAAENLCTLADLVCLRGSLANLRTRSLTVSTVIAELINDEQTEVTTASPIP
ncbi:hypothetical protein OIY81_3698, partial [Cryptosporidium canis]